MSGGGGDGKDDFERRSKRRRTDDGRRDWRERAAGVLVRRPAGGVSSAAKGRRIRRTRQRQRASGREGESLYYCMRRGLAGFLRRRPASVRRRPILSSPPSLVSSRPRSPSLSGEESWCGGGGANSTDSNERTRERSRVIIEQREEKGITSSEAVMIQRADKDCKCDGREPESLVSPTLSGPANLE